MIVSSGRRLSRLVDDILDFSACRIESSAWIFAISIYSLSSSSWCFSVDPWRRARRSSWSTSCRETCRRFAPTRTGSSRSSTTSSATRSSSPSAARSSSPRRSRRADPRRRRRHRAGDRRRRARADLRALRAADDASTARSFGGTGLGLAITRDLVQLHGGTLRADSVLGEGSRFRFSLPLGQERVGAPAVGAPSEGDTAKVRANMRLIEPLPSSVPATDEIDLAALRSEQESAPLRSRDVNPETREPAKILIVDDEPVVRQVLVNHLGLSGYRVLQAKNGPRGAPPIGGRARSRPARHHDAENVGFRGLRQYSPALLDRTASGDLLSAKNPVEDLLQGFATGANDYVSKPVVKAELIARVETHLKLRDLHLTMERLVEKRTHQVKRLGGLLPICSRLQEDSRRRRLLERGRELPRPPLGGLVHSRPLRPLYPRTLPRARGRGGRGRGVAVAEADPSYRRKTAGERLNRLDLARLVGEAPDEPAEAWVVVQVGEIVVVLEVTGALEAA